MTDQIDIPIRSDDGSLSLIRASGAGGRTAGLLLRILDRDGIERGQSVLHRPEMEWLRKALDDFLSQ